MVLAKTGPKIGQIHDARQESSKTHDQSQFENSRPEDLKGAIIDVSQYGSEADTFARNALATAGLKPDKDVTIIQLGGHPQVAAAMVAGKLEVGALAGLAALTVERSGARLLASAVELKILSPSGTFG